MATIAGTPGYLCPEMLGKLLYGGSEYDAVKSDVWAMGALLSHMLLGHSPFYFEEVRHQAMVGACISCIVGAHILAGVIVFALTRLHSNFESVLPALDCKRLHMDLYSHWAMDDSTCYVDVHSVEFTCLHLTGVCAGFQLSGLSVKCSPAAGLSSAQPEFARVLKVKLLKLHAHKLKPVHRHSTATKSQSKDAKRQTQETRIEKDTPN